MAAFRRAGDEQVNVFEVDADTKSAERQALRELEDRFDDDVSLTDLRDIVSTFRLSKQTSQRTGFVRYCHCSRTTQSRT